MEEICGAQESFDIFFNQHPPDRTITDFLFLGVVAGLIVMFVAIPLWDEAAPDPLNHLWDFHGRDSIKSDKFNDKVADPVLNPTIGTLDLLRVGTLKVVPSPGNCFLNFMGTCFLRPTAFHLEPVDIPMERRNPLF